MKIKNLKRKKVFFLVLDIHKKINKKLNLKNGKQKLLIKSRKNKIKKKLNQLLI